MSLSAARYGSDVIALPGGTWQHALALFVSFVENIKGLTPVFRWNRYTRGEYYGKTTLMGSEYESHQSLPYYANNLPHDEWIKRLLFLLCFDGVGGHVAKAWSGVELHLDRPIHFWQAISGDVKSQRFAELVVASSRNKYMDYNTIGVSSRLPVPVLRPYLQPRLANLTDAQLWHSAGPDEHKHAEIALGRWCVWTWASELCGKSFRSIFDAIDALRRNPLHTFDSVYVSGLDADKQIDQGQLMVVLEFDRMCRELGASLNWPSYAVQERVCRFGSVRVLSLASQAVACRVQKARRRVEEIRLKDWLRQSIEDD